MKKVKYENKCKINLIDVNEFIEKYKYKDVNRVLIVQPNNYITVGAVIKSEGQHFLLNYKDDIVNSIKYILENAGKDDFDINKYDNHIFNEFINTNKLNVKTKSIKDWAKYVAVLDDYEFLLDAPDIHMKDNTINLLTYDPDIDYYSRCSSLFVVQNDCDINEVQNMSFFPKDSSHEAYFIELEEYKFYSNVKYLNYFLNFEFYYNNELIML